MSRNALPALLILGGLIAFTLWIARHTYWRETETVVPPTGRAAIDPFYAAEKLVGKLGAQGQWRHGLGRLSPTDALVMGDWSLAPFPARTATLERWVAAGGRLVIYTRFLGADAEELARWTGIKRMPPPDFEPDSNPDPRADDVVVASIAPSGRLRAPRHYRVCCLAMGSHLESQVRPTWTLRNSEGHLEGVRIPIGRGSVTAVNGELPDAPVLFDDDNALLFVHALQLRRGDTIYFLSDAPGPTLLGLVWRTGWPAILLGGTLLMLWLWRSWPRFGPLEALPDTARRSLAEQIRGTGQFVLRYGRGRALHAATLRALRESAARHIPAYGSLTREARAVALARLTGLNGEQLARALDDSTARRRRDLHNTLALLESARRTLEASHPGRDILLARE